MPARDRKPNKKPGRAGDRKQAGDRGRATERGAAGERRGHRDTDPPEIKRWVDYPSPKYRRRAEPAATEPAETPRRPGRDPLRVRRSGGTATAPERPARRPAAREHPARRRRRQQTEALEELARLAGAKRARVVDQMSRAADLYRGGREREALRLLRPLASAYPTAAGVHELVGLCHYRIGQFPAARASLERFVALSGTTEQHPVLMDSWRAAGKHRKVEQLWEELAAASPSAELVTEGRIVMAGSLADRGKLAEGIALLDRRAALPKRVQEHHLRLWYALADLYDRAGNAPAARRWFGAVAKRERGFADVAERLAALGS